MTISKATIYFYNIFLLFSFLYYSICDFDKYLFENQHYEI